jgi:hypothetical protein
MSQIVSASDFTPPQEAMNIASATAGIINFFIRIILVFTNIKRFASWKSKFKTIIDAMLKSELLC